MFEKIYGHEEQKITLQNAINNNRISHAYLFSGPSGVGKKTLAFEFAKSILNTDNLETCVDFKYIEKKEDKKEIIVEQIRESITDDVIERPISGTRKVYIINDAEALNTSAQNALLKTLEEPPEYITIILIAKNLSMLLPTIISRVSKIDFNGVDKLKLKEYINNNNILLDESAIDFASGSIGTINEIIENNMSSNFEKVSDLLKLIEQGDVVSSLIKSQEIDFNNQMLLNYLEYMLFKDAHYEATLEVKRAINRLKMNGNYDIVIDNMIMKCVERL